MSSLVVVALGFESRLSIVYFIMHRVFFFKVLRPSPKVCESVSWQNSMKKPDEQWECVTLCVKKTKTHTGGGEGTKSVNTACPEGR